MRFIDLLKFEIHSGYKILQKLSWASCITLDKLIKLTIPQFSHLYVLDNFRTYLLGFSQGLNELMYVKN